MANDSKTLGKVVQIDDRRIQDHLGELVRGTVEETLNTMLDAEADALCGAQRYERSPDRVDTRAGSYERSQKWTPNFGQPFKCILPTHPAA